MRIPKKFAVLLLSLLLTCCGDSREKVQPAGNEVGTVSRFVLENIMEERIVIPDKYRLTDLQGNVSCDCLKIASFQKKLPPSETAVLYLTYRPEHPGFDRKQIAFFFKEQGVFNCILKMYVTM